MPNIFDGILALTDNQLRYRIASLEEVNVVNRVSEMGQTVRRGAMNFMNALRKVWDGKGIDVPDVVRIDERIRKRQTELSTVKREELNRRLRKNLIIRLGFGAGAADRLSDDELSVMLIEYAWKTFKNDIPEGLSYAEKADEIFRLYSERFSDKKNIYSGSDLITWIVWDSVRAYGQKFAPAEESLPSSRLPEEEKQAAISRNHEARGRINDTYRLQKGYTGLLADSDRFKHSIEDELDELAGLKKRVQKEKEQLSKDYTEKANTKIAADQAFLALQRFGTEHYENLSSEENAELVRLTDDYNTLREKLENMESLLSGKNERIESDLRLIEQKENHVEELKVSLYRSSLKLAEADHVLIKNGAFTDDLVERETEELESRWLDYFKKFSFKEGVIGYVAENYKFDELIALEKRLAELHGTDDPKALRYDRKNSSDENLYLEFMTGDNSRTRIYYSRSDEKDEKDEKKSRKKTSVDRIMKILGRNQL